MNPRNIALIVVGVLVAGGVAIAVVFASTGGDATDTASTPTASASAEAAEPSATEATESAQPSEEPAEAAEQEAAVSPGAYVEYSPAALEAAEGEKVLFFHATWCPQCRALEADIQGSGVPDGVTVLKVDYDSNQDLRAKYGVTLQTTLVHVDESGELIDRYVAYEQPVLAPSLAALGIAGS